MELKGRKKRRRCDSGVIVPVCAYLRYFGKLLQSLRRPADTQDAFWTRETAIERCQEILAVAQRAQRDAECHTEFKCRFNQLENVYSEFERQHSSLIALLSQNDNPEDMAPEKAIRVDFDNNYFAIHAIYRDLFENKVSHTRSSDNCDNIKLPKLKLPTFNGDFKSWPTFFDLFNSTIHENSSLSNAEKFQYLLSQLENEPLSLIKAIPSTGDNYVIAYNTLVKRYQNKRLLATTYWDELNNLPTLTSESPQSLRHLLDAFSENISALKQLGFQVDAWDFILFQLLIRKLDSDTTKRFELQYDTNNPNTDIPTFKELEIYLNKQCSALTSANLASPKTTRKGGHCNKNSVIRKYNSQSSSSFIVNTDSKPLNICLLCNSEHALYRCSSFLAKSLNERYNFAKQKKAILCKRRHHTLLHFEKESKAVAASNPSLTSVETNIKLNDLPSTSTSSNINTLTSVISNTTVLLSTANIEILDIFGNYQTILVVIDSGSQASFITEKCFRRLGLRRFHLRTPIQGLGEMSSEATSGVTCKIKPLGLPSPILLLDAIIVPKICSNLPSSNISVKNWKHIGNIKLADNNFNISSPIDMLLGADIFAEILQDGRLLGNDNEPTALRTIFGWILHGKVSYQPSSSVNSFFTSFDYSVLDSNLRRFWELEEIPRKHITSTDDLLCEQIYTNTYSRDYSGRYTVSLPFRSSEPEFNDSRSLALRRFYSLERRLLRNPSLYAERYIVDAERLQRDLSLLLKRGGFELRKWASNHPQVLQHIPLDERQISPLSFDTPEDSTVKILGLRWNPHLDSFSYVVDTHPKTCSKRNILSELARIFDPLGFLSPLTFFVKYLIQHLWTLGLGWDDLPPPQVIDIWDRFKNELSCLLSLNIPRRITIDSPSSCEIHGFSDSGNFCKKMTQHFWQRWQNEYLNTLMQRQKCNKERTIVDIDTLVRLGHVVAMHPGSDGVYRVATVRTSEGLVKRPVVKLCPLPAQ
ncbi:hypothetical protein NQ318_017031 [Aromia moschata]|uniref:DUF5641 domain-containing protein n=1 Tax=Aromia moschata TaxID=1265417 RepID=A0AAV8XEM4_9CUCU|nr:hypothetical protein NQ318_017031 [Aromia moschata]